MRRLLAAALIVLAGPAAAERLVSTVANPQVLITSSFDGATLSLFGSIEPDGMLNGATIRLRRTQAATARIKSDLKKPPGVSVAPAKGGSA